MERRSTAEIARDIMAKSHLELVKPATEKRTVTPRRRPNAKLRTREYLTEAEVERLIEAAKFETNHSDRCGWKFCSARPEQTSVTMDRSAL